MKFNTYLYGQIIYDTKSKQPYGIELLGRPIDSKISIEEHFANMSPEDAYDWTTWQLERACDVGRETGLLVTVNVDTNVIPLIDFSQYADCKMGVEFTYTQQLPTVSQILKIKEQMPHSKMILDDYKLDSSLFGGYFTGPNIKMFDIIKFDISVMNKLKHNTDIMLIDSMVRTLRLYQVELIIEGAEEELDTLLAKSAHIDLIQGFYFNRPKRLVELLDDLKK